MQVGEQKRLHFKDYRRSDRTAALWDESCPLPFFKVSFDNLCNDLSGSLTTFLAASWANKLEKRVSCGVAEGHAHCLCDVREQPNTQH